MYSGFSVSPWRAEKFSHIWVMSQTSTPDFRLMAALAFSISFSAAGRSSVSASAAPMLRSRHTMPSRLRIST